ncbi:tRNA glutamyl-Q(34) synthetase GluQRS [Paludisphaera rhizosphaerae]|uniref:tRNA glutamyl-Q(34) synthetase GluQRS n=1 Tax=Paludisphaera rhizosphaerae TaxID=2711216 RepID=UPI0013EBE745|nr:tRNA glutamyl-Q(34) synthetase GluQRS [Paludisphaera rhizosphaerae]
MTLRQERRPGAGRLAPSPTGGLHVGHARSFLIAWLASRQAGGPVVLRIEDLDASRARPEAADSVLVDLRWLGLDWDEGPDVDGPFGPYIQSQRRTIYEESLNQLKAAELVYPCTCTRADIERAASAPHAEDEGPTYPGTCANRSAADAAGLGDRPFAWRFRVPAGPVAWDDLFLGTREIDPARIGGDFIVGRNGQGPAYQLAVVVDDAFMGIDQVIRGDDLVPSTPRQLLLYRAFGWTPPRFGHVPLVVGPDGRRLAKRDGSIKLSALRDAGVDPRRLVGSLAASLGAPSSTRSSPGDLISEFDLAEIPTSAWVASPAAWSDGL